MNNLLDRDVGDATCRCVAKALEIDHVDNIPVQCKLERCLKPNVRALSEAVNKDDWTQFLFDSDILDHGAEVIEAGVISSLGGYILA